MRGLLCGLGLLALSASACVHSSEVAQQARHHDQLAAQARQRGDWQRSASEQREAERLRQMAEEKRFHETATAPVLRPAQM